MKATLQSNISANITFDSVPVMARQLHLENATASDQLMPDVICEMTPETCSSIEPSPLCYTDKRMVGKLSLYSLRLLKNQNRY